MRWELAERCFGGLSELWGRKPPRTMIRAFSAHNCTVHKPRAMPWADMSNAFGVLGSAFGVMSTRLALCAAVFGVMNPLNVEIRGVWSFNCRKRRSGSFAT
jgi:hypothetical protein